MICEFDFFIFFSLCVLCAAGNHQMCRLGQQQRSLHCPFDLPVRYHRGDLFEHVHHVQVSLESYFLIILSCDVKIYILRDTVGTNVFCLCFFVVFFFVPLRSSGKMCPWLQAWPSCPNETPTRRRQTLSCIPRCLEDKTPLLPSGGASRTTQGCA